MDILCKVSIDYNHLEGNLAASFLIKNFWIFMISASPSILYSLLFIIF